MRKRQRKKNTGRQVRWLNRRIKLGLRKHTSVTVDILLPPEICGHEVVLNETNNPPESIAAGYMKADIYFKMTRPVQTLTVTRSARR
jgi:hypothetical protein